MVLVTIRHLLRPHDRHSLTIDVRKVSTGGGVAFDGVQMRVLNDRDGRESSSTCGSHIL